MKLTDLKPCSCCNGPLLARAAGIWYVLWISPALISTRAANSVLGLAQAMGGLEALPIAEAMSPHTDDAVVIMGDKDPHLRMELHLCFDCFHMKHLQLGMVTERVNKEAARGEIQAVVD